MRAWTLNRGRTLALALVMALVLAGCTKLQIGWTETNLPGTWRASYRLYTGHLARPIRGDAGNVLELEYKSVVESGSLSIELAKPGGEVLAEIPVGEEGTEKIELPESGMYQLKVEGSKARGNFSLNWSVR